MYCRPGLLLAGNVRASRGVYGNRGYYFEKIRVFKAGVSLYTLAWNNRIGLWFYFVGF